MWWKVLLLGVYLLLMLVVSRILEIVAWFGDDGKSVITASIIVDPFALSVRTLKQILDNRGVSYTGVLEKHELCDLVESSGQTSESEIAEVENQNGAANTLDEKSATQFTCGFHFNEEVEDKKDSIWLVLVKASDGHSVIGESTLKELTSKIQRFGVRTGVFDCSLDERMCSRRGWSSSQVILALPSTKLAKKDVKLHKYNVGGKFKPQAIINWISRHLAQRVTKISSQQELEQQWLRYTNPEKESAVRVVFLTDNLPQPPIFISALSVKFSGRVKFGMLNAKNRQGKPSVKGSAAYLVITPEGRYVYGNQKGEIIGYKSLEFFLRSLTPEMNDMFVVSIVLVNLFTILELFLIKGKVWKHVMRNVWNIARNNCILFLLWLVLLGLFKFSIVNTVSGLFLTLTRTLGCMDTASFVRREWDHLQSRPLSLAMSYLAFCALAGWLWKKYKTPRSREDSVELFDWLTGPIDSYIMNCFFRPMATLTRPMVPQDLDLEEGMELLIERLAVPNLWLQPIISSDYIKNLATWRYDGPCSSDESAVSSEDEVREPTRMFGWMRSSNQDHSSLTSDIINVIFKNNDTKQGSPIGVIESHECSICLEKYRSCTELCGLPCGHAYHVNCILSWLYRDNHCCPICRWPSYKPKIVAIQ